jgi:hypothetical protein
MIINKGLLMAMALTLLHVATARAASIVDAPHNSVHGVSCGSCHSYSLWWRYSPTNQSLTPTSNEIVNGVCNRCHDGSQPGIPVQHTHSSSVIASTAHGTWEAACTACHDPHFQGQLDWVDTTARTFPAGLYVVKGTISAVAQGTVAGTTNIGYANAPADNLSGDWTDRGRWGKKNDHQDLDRGLILVVDTGKAENTYQVISANNAVITVQGGMSADDTDKSFGLIYGQLIKKEITTPASGKRQVTFFDPDTLYSQGGFTDHEASRQGICQVCHTATSHWTRDGLHDDHNPDLKCTNCHDRVQGFKPALPGHAYLINTTPCTNCHQHGANDPLAIHGNRCQTCHTTPPRLRSDSGNFQHVTRIGLDPTGPVVANNKHATACTYCHAAYFGGHSHDHAASVAVNSATTPLTANCLGCHPASTTPFVAAGEVHGASGCATCHNLAANGALTGSAATATAPYGQCTSCHNGYFANHDHGAVGGSPSHAISQGNDALDGKPCALCHNGSGGGLASWPDILVEHQSDCGMCHNSQRATNVGVSYTSVADCLEQADAQHPLTCLSCHANHGNDHQGRYVSAYEDADQPLPVVLTTCTVNCHPAAFATSATAPKLHASCTSCHTNTAIPVTLTGSAVGKRVPEANPFNNCYTCHGANYFANHTAMDHSAKVTTTSDNTCERCHSGDTITSATTHRGLCTLCHDTARGGILTSLAVAGPGNCTTCHHNNWLTIHTQATVSNHSQAVAMTPACSACHATTAGTAGGIAIDPRDNTVHASCASCHDGQGRLLGSASGHQGGADCQTCHGAFGLDAHAQVDHATRVGISQACSFCHSEAAGTASGILVALANTRIHGSCASCHGTTGALIGAAAGKSDNNSCESCHGLFAVRHGNQDHAATVAMATDCSSCHAGAQGTALGMTLASDGKHHAACTNCHGLTGALTGFAFGHEGGGDCHTCHGTFAAQHGGVDHAASVAMGPACATCHTNTTGTTTGMPISATDPSMHSACSQCHGNDGTLVSLATGRGPSNSCTDCHTQASQHQSAHFLHHDQATDRGQSTNQACNACHGADGADEGTTPLDGWGEILALHKSGNCALCHGASREVVDNQGQSQSPVRTVAAVILAATNPTNCLACHLDKEQPAEHGFDHLASGIISGLARCTSCHTDPNLLTGIHGAHQCTTCHDKTTAPVILKGSAIGHGKAAVAAAGQANTCGSCHATQAADFTNHATADHVAKGLVVKTSNATCEMCHSADDTIGDSRMHQGRCAACHTASPGSAADGTLIGAASGKLGGGNCTACHPATWLTIHQQASPGISHLLAVAMATECSACHAGADGMATGMTVDPQDGRKHQGCSSCHNADGQLIGSAGGKLTTNACTDCHGSFMSQHAAADHTSLVAMAIECSGCHTASGNTVDPNNPMVHASCAQCHGMDGALVGAAVGHNNGGSCTTCHGGFAVIHAGQDHGTRVSLSTECSGCHAGAEGQINGMAVGGSAMRHNACASCHGSTGALVSIAVGRGGGAQCTTCHGLFSVKHATTDHSFRAGLNTECADCHGGSQGSASGMPTNAALNTMHSHCGQCHGTTGTLTGVAAGKEGATSTTPNLCATCHGGFSDNHAAVDHTAMVRMQANCATCHAAVGNTVDLDDPKVHHACASCHLTNGRLSGSAAGKDGATVGGRDGGGDCAFCHGGFSDNHATVNHASRVAMATECSGCHSASGNTVAPNDAKTHHACASCHEADGALRGSAVSHAGGGSCITCHGSFATIHGNEPHITLVALSLDCSGCHGGSEGTVSGMPVGGSAKQHAACASCHGATGALVSIAVGKGGGAECNSCHGLFAVQHAPTNHAFRVSLAANCADCHAASAGMASGMPTSVVDNTMHDNCIQCHGATGTLVGLAAGKEGATLASANDCSTCHGGFSENHGGVNHGTMVAMNANCGGCHTITGNTVIPGDAKAHHACASCHLANGRLTGAAIGQDGSTLGGMDGGGDCATCHGGFANNHATVNHASRVAMATECADCHTAVGNTVHPTDAKTHHGCASCHGANGALTGTASNHAGGGSCTVCHGGFTNNHGAVDHSTTVSMNANCNGCHTASGNTVIPGDAKAHHACTSCHLANGRLTGVAQGKDGATPGGRDGGGDCATCHGTFATNHATVNHESRVAMATQCSGCHTAVANTVDPNDPKVHDACTTCHTENGSLNGSAVNHAGGGNCAVCHGSFATIHATRDHGTRVALSTDCTGCHGGAQGTVSGMPVGGSAMKHAACASCHGTTGILVSIAAGHGGSAQCNTCHGSFAAKHANTDHSFRVALDADCADCHTGTQGLVSGMPVSVSDNKRHDSCVACHGQTGTLTGAAVGKEGASASQPNTCKNCHGLFTNNHATVNHATMVSMSDHCAGCHTNTGNTVDPADPRTHDACTSCHDPAGRLVNQAVGHNGGTQGGSDGGGACTVCHGEYLPNHQSVNHDQRSIYFGGALNCSGCHSSDATVLGYAGTGKLLTQNDVNSLHSRPTGDACSLCHYYNAATQANPDGLPLWSTVRTAIVNGTNGTADATCVVCHGYNQTGVGHWNQPPTFNPTTFTKAAATVGVAYSGQSLTGTASDPEGDAITYSKVSGPSWLTVAANGTLGGTPTVAANDSFVVRATALGGSAQATMTITVAPRP